MYIHTSNVFGHRSRVIYVTAFRKQYINNNLIFFLLDNVERTCFFSEQKKALCGI